MAPQVTVLLPVRNAAAYIAEAMASTLAQSFVDFEVLVIDDGSTDGTVGIVEGMADPRVRIVHNPVNLGISTSMNIGLELARGGYVARMDGDDVMAPDRLAAQVALLNARPEVTVCGTDLEQFGTTSSLSDAAEHDCDIKALFLEGARNIFNPTATFRRDFVMARRVRCNPAYVAGGDLAFWVDCMRAGAVFANIKKPLLRYRWHGSNVSRDLDLKRVALFNIRRRLAADFFPHLSQAEADALANLLTGRPVESGSFSFPGLCEAVAAAAKAKSWTRSQFGESRDVLNQILDNRVLQFQRAVLGQNG